MLKKNVNEKSKLYSGPYIKLQDHLLNHYFCLVFYCINVTMVNINK